MKSATVLVEIEEMIEAISHLPREDVLHVIKMLDQSQQDWNFTEELEEYFNGLMETLRSHEIIDHTSKILYDGGQWDEDEYERALANNNRSLTEQTGYRKR